MFLIHVTFGVHSLDLICGFAGPAGPKPVKGPDSVGVPLALDQISYLKLGLEDQVPAGLPLNCSSLAAVHIVTADAAATVVLWRLPGQEDSTGRLVSPPQVLWRVWNRWRGEIHKLFNTET